MKISRGLFFLLGLATALTAFLSETRVARAMESEKELIEKARQLLLQKERVSAIAFLTASAQRENKLGNSVKAKSLIQALDEVANTFITDKAQQSYELGLSLLEQDPEQALSKLEDAARVEPKNFVVELQVVRTHIILGQCSEAAIKARALIGLNPFSADAHLVLAQSVLCLNDLAEFKRVRLAAVPIPTENKIYWELLSSQEAVLSGADASTLEKAKAQLRDLDKMPESHYWIWRLDQNLSKMKIKKIGPLPKQNADKYLALCKNPAKGLQRLYSKEPLLCRHVIEVENQIKTLE